LSRTKTGNSPLSIAAVERDVGLSKDVLRVWERRYGFPLPTRTPTGERLYPLEQVERLRLIKRLMDHGHRPGRLLASSVDELGALETPRSMVEKTAADEDGDLDRLIGHITQHQNDAFIQALQQRLARDGLQRFVQDTVAPLSALIGLAWQEGRLQVFEEHRFTEATERVLRQAIGAVPPGRAPRVLLTSVPGEPHALGLLMAEAVLSLEGASCISLGTQTPLPEIVRAAAAHEADVVALSFSTVFQRRRVQGLLAELRAALPPHTRLWAGGGGVSRVAAPTGVELTATWGDAVAAVDRWRGKN
jgi:DNA-binding transcriptional MerR regulator/methylmalonyl-CoA mutase cobalamin-binding subunit